jgi:putative hydrolase of the HAD superfamily
VAPERILYVGNSVEYDVRGAKAVGMRTALITLWPRKRRAQNAEADFIFSDYRQLRGYVLS